MERFKPLWLDSVDKPTSGCTSELRYSRRSRATCSVSPSTGITAVNTFVCSGSRPAAAT
ncbi:Uncharacterised protein [Mycobacteroides abscessus subsp. abscessus]|nr:Uncharacterised protein [Mycobacteroides abscessus subsp. abscessus]